ncbi:MAG: hypothetical protein JJ992_05440, partial [Planctomycetes bacterium]|nr:hypothetical protein [Planctomycetota bacterium]
MTRFILAAAIFSLGVTAPSTASAQSDDEYIEEIITTGTRIVRTDQFQEAGHVVAMDEIAIDAIAELNIADVLRS